MVAPPLPPPLRRSSIPTLAPLPLDVINLHKRQRMCEIFKAVYQAKEELPIT